MDELGSAYGCRQTRNVESRGRESAQVERENGMHWSYGNLNVRAAMDTEDVLTGSRATLRVLGEEKF
jgi:hypothetical protein